MPRINILREIDIKRTPRVMQVEGIFDMPLSERSAEKWEVNLELPANWNIGLIVGPSGSGKSTIARELFGDYLVKDWLWDNDKSILDGFPKELSIKEITSLLSSVGFSSPPSWLRPFRVLSNGEQFRVNMARTLAEMTELAVVDEFTSVVDRTVAQIGSAAIQKTVRNRNQKLIVVSCHYDILDWLEPDWVYQPHTGELLVGRSLHKRPKIELQVKRVHYSAWKLFGKHHYLDNNLNKASYCFVAFWNSIPVGFCAVLPFPHPIRPGWRFHRLVCLPDYQGVGIGSSLADYVGAIMKSTNKPVFRTLAHPAVIHAANKSTVWKMTRKPSRSSGGTRTAKISLKKTFAIKRILAGFEYVGPALDKTEAAKILGLSS
jgi:ABC-type lipoprotein export system ATPase subunit